jgi:hypothetical protein
MTIQPPATRRGRLTIEGPRTIHGYIASPLEEREISEPPDGRGFELVSVERSGIPATKLHPSELRESRRGHRLRTDRVRSGLDHLAAQAACRAGRLANCHRCPNYIQACRWEQKLNRRPTEPGPAASWRAAFRASRPAHYLPALENAKDPNHKVKVGVSAAKRGIDGSGKGSVVGGEGGAGKGHGMYGGEGIGGLCHISKGRCRCIVGGSPKGLLPSGGGKPFKEIRQLGGFLFGYCRSGRSRIG